MKRAAALALVIGLSLLSAACDQDPHRIGIERLPGGGLVVHYANCDGKTLVSRVAVSPSGARYSPRWEIEADAPGGMAHFRFPVGETPDGFGETVPLLRTLAEGRYVAIVDSSFLFEHSYSFETAELRIGRVLTGDGDYLTVSDFEDGGVC